MASSETMVVSTKSIRSKVMRWMYAAEKLAAKKKVWMMIEAGEPTQRVMPSAACCKLRIGFSFMMELLYTDKSPLIQNAKPAPGPVLFLPITAALVLASQIKRVPVILRILLYKRAP